jgi:hypothetical protein
MRKLLTLWIALAAIVGGSTSSFAQGGMMPGPGTPHSVSGCTPGTQATNFLARTSGLSGTETTAYCTLINGLVTDSIITGTMAGSGSGAAACGSLLDALYVFATNTTTTANLNLCSTSYGLTQTGGVTFTADVGYTGNGSTGFLNTNFNPGLGGTNWPGGGAGGTLASYIQNNRTTVASKVSVGGGDGSDYSLIDPVRSTGFLFDINGGTFPAITNSSSQGAWVVTRTSSSSISVYKNAATSFGTGTSTSVAAPNVPFYIFALNNNATAIDFSDDQLSFVFAGATMTSTQAFAINARINQFLIGVGAPHVF